MYVGWLLIHLGVGAVAGSAWTMATAPMAGVLIHREVLAEEPRLEAEFGAVYREYRATVRRYI